MLYALYYILKSYIISFFGIKKRISRYFISIFNFFLSIILL